jgi:predicted class III extradiol MEMO1 family dioxygenase
MKLANMIFTKPTSGDFCHYHQHQDELNVNIVYAMISYIHNDRGYKILDTDTDNVCMYVPIDIVNNVYHAMTM